MKRMRRISIVLAIAALAAGVLAASASAFPNFVYSSSFGSSGTGNGQFEIPSAIATDSSGNVWVADTENDRIQKFNSKGEYLSQFDEGKFGLIEPTDIAVTSKGDVWVVDRGGQRIVKFNPAGEYLGEFGELGSGNGQFWYPTHIAIDSKGNLWITDESNYRVQEFNSEGKYLRQFGKEGTGNGQFTYMTGIATDSTGNVWVVDWQVEGGRIEKFNSEGSYLGQVAGGQLHEPIGDALTIDAENNLWAFAGFAEEDVLKIFNSTGEKISQLSASPPFYSLSVAFDPSGNPWIINGALSRVEKWVRAAPQVTTEAATSVKSTEATLNATVNPQGTSTTYQFEYGPTISYGSKAPASPVSAGSGTSNVAVKQAIGSLAPNTTYHFRVVATSAAGTTNGADKTFKTEAGPSTAAQLGGMATTEPFDGSATSIANFGTNWSALGWANGSPAKGEDLTTGWRSVSAYPKVSGAFYNSSITDTGPGIAAVVNMGANPGSAESYFSVWLDMASPTSTRSGYEARFTYLATGNYNVTLSKWQAGVQTSLASVSNYAFGIGNSVALLDQGGTVGVWTKTGGEFTKLLSASDAAFGGGNAGLEAAGNSTRLLKFKVGSLLSPVANMNAALQNLALNDPFATNENPLSGGGAWAVLGGDAKPGYVSGGWAPIDAYPALNGAYWTKASFPDTGAGVGVAATLSVRPTNVSRYFSLWLDLATPASQRTGYELRFTETSVGIYEVVLRRWQGGAATILNSKTGYSLPLNSKFALVDKGSTVTVWTKPGAEYTQILSATDATFNSGYTGLEGSGNITRIKDFRSGPLPPF